MVYSQSMIGAAGMTDCIAKVRRGDPPRGDESLGQQPQDASFVLESNGRSSKT